MPDTYITIPDKKGSVNISEDVIAVIAANAVKEVDGITAFSNTVGTELGELIGKKTSSKGVRVSVEEDTVRIEITVMVRYGANITSLGEKAQSTVATAVESMTGLKPVVNVHVAGIAFDK